MRIVIVAAALGTAIAIAYFVGSPMFGGYDMIR